MEVTGSLDPGVVYQYSHGPEVTLWMGIGRFGLGYIAWTSVLPENNPGDPHLAVAPVCPWSLERGEFQRVQEPEEWV